MKDPENIYIREKVASIYGRFGRFRAIDYTTQYYNKYISEHKGTASIKLFSYS